MELGHVENWIHSGPGRRLARTGLKNKVVEGSNKLTRHVDVADSFKRGLDN